jgi:hypothetical protein
LLIGAIFASLSKVSFFQIGMFASGLATIYVLRCGMFWILSIITYLTSTHLLLTYVFKTKEQFFSLNSSIYERLQGGILFLESEIRNLIFGHGYLGVCENLNKSEFYSEHTTGYSELATGGRMCSLGVHSLFGSFILEAGLAGVLYMAIFVTFLEPKKISKEAITGLPMQLIFILIICSLTSVHWLTALPPVFVTIALLFTNRKARSRC